MDQEELRLESEAFTFIKSHKKELIRRFANPGIYKSVSVPISLFMAGSPGAGKTEVSKSLIKRFQDIPVRIDADEIRKMCPEYKGSNAHVFQKAATKGVHILFDHSLDHKLNLILDGTFAYDKAQDNVKRSLEHKRTVELWFVYQDPLKAWEVTKAREAEEFRHVSKEVFIKAFFEARRNIVNVKNIFDKDVQLNLLIKDYDKHEEDLKLSIRADELDGHIRNGYTESELEKLLL